MGFKTCDNGERLQLAFALNTCDRVMMRYVISTAGIEGSMTRDLMAETDLYHFGQIDQVPHQIQWLTDNGPCDIARETVLFGRSVGLEICATRSCNPEGSGMAEAFVKTVKKDHVWLGDLSSADAVIKQLPKWFDNDNTHAPHKCLKMRSRKQYIQKQKNHLINWLGFEGKSTNHSTCR